MSKQHEQALLLLRKADADLSLVEEVWDSEQVANEIIGFHCQQAAEKLLKSLLSEFGVSFARTHNLRVLMDLITDAGHALPSELADLDVLTPFGTVFRYEDIPPAQASLDRHATRIMLRVLRTFVDRHVQP
jgi:HEPN domain-containing protein